MLEESPSTVEPTASASTRKTLQEVLDDWWDEKRFQVYIGGLCSLLVLAFLSPRMFVTIPAGHRGVMFRRFAGGTITNRIWPEGFHVVPPWDHLTIYEVRVQEEDMSFPILTKEGLELTMTVSMRYQPVLKSLGVLHREVGPDYLERVIKPEIQSDLRKNLGDRTAYAIYSTEGDVLQEVVSAGVQKISEKYIHLDELLIKKIELPQIVRDAVEQKHKQEQLMLEYQFRLQREEKEAERKRAEAAGIRDFQNIISQGISEDMLRWRGIEATLELAKSSNAKVIVVGSGKTGMPLLFDTQGAVSPLPPPDAGAARHR